MKVWIVHQYALPPSEAGGTRHFNFAREWAEEGHDVTIFCSNVSYLSRRIFRPETVKSESINKVNFRWIASKNVPSNGLNRAIELFRFASRLRNTLKAETDWPDIVVGSSPSILAAYEGLKFSKSKSIPFILEVRDLWPSTLVQLGRISEWNPIVLFFSYIESRLYKSAQRIVTLLPSSTEYLVKRGAERTKIFWIPNGVIISPLATTSHGEPHRFRFLYAGAHGAANGLEHLLRAANIVRSRSSNLDFELVFVGDGPTKSDLIIETDRLELKSIVQFKDPVPKQDMQQLLSEADVLIHNLVSANLFSHGLSPNKLFDYMAAGKPVIYGCPSEENPVSLSGCGRTTKPSDERDIAEAMLALMQLTEERRREIGNSGRQYVLEHHDASSLAKGFMDVLQSEF